MTAIRAAGVFFQAVAVTLCVIGAYNLFRTITMDLRRALKEGEGAAFTRIAAITLGVATALWLSGSLLLR